MSANWPSGTTVVGGGGRPTGLCVLVAITTCTITLHMYLTYGLINSVRAAILLRQRPRGAGSEQRATAIC